MAKPKVAKKEWYPIIAPKIFRGAVIGETIVYDPNKMIGKSMSENLMNLTNDVKKQNIKVVFEVVNVENNRALTEITGYKMVPSSVKRLVRRNIEKIDMSFSCSTSDNKNLRIKPLIITRSAVSSSVGAKIRRNAEDFIIKYVQGISYDNLANDLITHKLQDLLRASLNKIYPLRICEIRSMQISKAIKEESAPKQEAAAKKKAKHEKTKDEKNLEDAKPEPAKKAQEEPLTAA
ncbi:hypothetical protein HYU50_03980 [Candidatus Woesearchaeota archaeon]|nr:hypothetical protein [Candidatus Woesearchaeota archaeon]